MIILLCGLSGAGKTTIGLNTKTNLLKYGIKVELIDGDEYRKSICRDLGFSRTDRMENIRRLGFIANRFSMHGVVTIISAINPYNEIREELKDQYRNVKVVFVDCPIHTLVERDTKGLYKRAFLPEGHPQKLNNLSGINDDFEIPEHPDLYLNTNRQSLEECTANVFSFVARNIKRMDKKFAISYLPGYA